MKIRPAALLRRRAFLCEQLPLAEIAKVTFLKRNEVTTDLICCDVAIAEGLGSAGSCGKPSSVSWSAGR
jgi:hypothetical protein